MFRLEADFCLHNVSLAGPSGGDLFTCCSRDEASRSGAGSPRVRLPPTPQVTAGVNQAVAVESSPSPRLDRSHGVIRLPAGESRLGRTPGKQPRTWSWG